MVGGIGCGKEIRMIKKLIPCLMVLSCLVGCSNGIDKLQEFSRVCEDSGGKASLALTVGTFQNSATVICEDAKLD